MQGELAEESIINALNAIAMREHEFDIVAIIRGGGSTSDLALFDSYLIATHVAQFPLPIFSGIGHDKDSSVVDIVAARSLKTPTAVADFKGGKEKAFGAIFGACMKELKGNGDPALIRELLTKELSK